MKISSIFAAVLGVLFSLNVLAADFSHSTPAVWGYDVVSYHTDKRPAKGSGHFAVDYKGATYLFASLEHKNLFSENPERYVPAYNGYCAFGVANGKKFAAYPEVWRIVDGTLYLNLDTKIQDLWLADTGSMIKDSDKHWKRIKLSAPASL